MIQSFAQGTHFRFATTAKSTQTTKPNQTKPQINSMGSAFSIYTLDFPTLSFRFAFSARIATMHIVLKKKSSVLTCLSLQDMTCHGRWGRGHAALGFGTKRVACRLAASAFFDAILQFGLHMEDTLLFDAFVDVRPWDWATGVSFSALGEPKFGLGLSLKAWRMPPLRAFDCISANALLFAINRI
jgi:hypothetical protein